MSIHNGPGGKKEDHEKLDPSTGEGEASGYISLGQARVLAIRYARGDTAFYGRAYAGTNLVWEVTGEEEDEDFYDIRLSFRPSGRFRGEPGVEQFIIDKTGAVQIRQILDEPTGFSGPARRGPPLLPTAGGPVMVALVAGGAFFFTSAIGGDDPPSNRHTAAHQLARSSRPHALLGADSNPHRHSTGGCGGVDPNPVPHPDAHHSGARGSAGGGGDRHFPPLHPCRLERHRLPERRGQLLPGHPPPHLHMHPRQHLLLHLGPPLHSTLLQPRNLGIWLNINGEVVTAGIVLWPVPNGSVILHRLPDADGTYPRNAPLTLQAIPDRAEANVLWGGVDGFNSDIATVVMTGNRFVVVLITP